MAFIIIRTPIKMRKIKLCILIILSDSLKDFDTSRDNLRTNTISRNRRNFNRFHNVKPNRNGALSACCKDSRTRCFTAR